MFPLRALFFLVATALAAMLAPPAKAAPFENTLTQRLQACTACHGPQGRAGPDGYYPRLAGKPAGYLFNQLVNFREGRRHYGLMTGLVDNLSEPYLQEIAQHFAALELPYPKPVPSAASAATLARGELLATRGDASLGLPACTQCHGTQLTGVLPQTPGLLGLPRDYLNAQLGGWKTGQRHAQAPDCMAPIARKLSDADTNAVTHWLSSQVVPSPARPANAAPAHISTAHTSPAHKPGDLGTECGSSREASEAREKREARDTPALATTAPFVPLTEPDARIAKGEYLARIGNCAGCHTARGGPAMAGGKRLDTEFGSFYTSNLTPHPTRGLGAWSPADFWQAMHHGKSRDGRLLYPAFPYTNYTHLTREDSDALLAFLKSLPASSQANRPHDLSWPYSSAWALGLWRWLYFSPADEAQVSIAAADTSATGDTARGSYLVNGLGHCSACHAPRNRLGAITNESLVGAQVPGTRWLAPALGRASPNPPWRREDLAQYLREGQSVHGNANGPMAEVVLGSTRYLTEGDARAIAAYLLPGTSGTSGISGISGISAPRASPISAPVLTAPAQTARLANGTDSRDKSTAGARLYEKHCADCHGASGRGVAGAYPALAGNATVTAPLANNLVQITLQGGFAPATPGNLRPFGMPPFQLQLSDVELSALLSFIRTSWGNAGTPLSELDIHQLRPSQTP